MTLYRSIPSDFPLHIDLSKRPLKYRLCRDFESKVLTCGLSAFLLIGGAVAVGAFGILAGLYFFGRESMYWAGVGAALIYVIAAGRWWLLPYVSEVFRHVEVEISETHVDVNIHGLLRRHSWSLPIKGFKGVSMLVQNLQGVGLHKVLIGSVVLDHPDPEKSVPFIIDELSQIEKSTIQTCAANLGVPVLVDAGERLAESAYTSNTILMNESRGSRLRLLLIGSLFCTLGFASVSISQFLKGTLDQSWVILFGIMLSLSIVIHVYATRYAIRIVLRDGLLWIETAAWLFATHRIRPARIENLNLRLKVFPIPSHFVDAPWVSMQVEGYRLPFLIDLQAEYWNHSLLSAQLIDRRTGI